MHGICYWYVPALLLPSFGARNKMGWKGSKFRNLKRRAQVLTVQIESWKAFPFSLFSKLPRCILMQHLTSIGFYQIANHNCITHEEEVINKARIKTFTILNFQNTAPSSSSAISGLWDGKFYSFLLLNQVVKRLFMSEHRLQRTTTRTRTRNFSFCICFFFPSI
ncbi:uncharacterized protein LOC110658173 [Hevea brasiliensis]|uniref:uncharacterized protein LOC110658173 n=1 Tax=Hevea brasiliensis TaxID=3981 RepID=UPI0025FCFC32|nr:uncharacterized protein LOC110658173 [Hevea brasiliensis]